MDKKTLQALESVNQLKLTEAEQEEVLGFFERQDKEKQELEAVDTQNVERMVHVMPINTVVREDIAKKLFSRDDLQKGAPETMDGYWQVPRLVD